jgi:hypothetical protein
VLLAEDGGRVFLETLATTNLITQCHSQNNSTEYQLATGLSKVV